MDSTICFDSYSYYPIDYYLLNIVDLSGQNQILNETTNLKDSKACTLLSESSFPSECSPFDIYVQAHNRVGMSNTSHTVVKGTTQHHADISLYMLYTCCLNIGYLLPFTLGL